ncbi:hypothetical protein [Methanosphaera sp.]|jgi:hypothetical protein|uniref:hypothetical protein n=1 Tax=Methanosphaera sp. TaxID=2666342 RepID=UPI003D8EED10
MVQVISKTPDWCQLAKSSKDALNKPQYGLKNWHDPVNLQNMDTVATCGEVTNPIGRAKDTYNNPACLYFAFQSNYPDGTKVTKIKLHYTQKVTSLASSQADNTFPKFNGPKITIYNQNTNAGSYTPPSKTGNAPTKNFVENTVEFTDIPLDEINIYDFGVLFDYPKNTSNNKGLIELKNVYMEFFIESAEILLTAQADNNKTAKGTYFNVTVNLQQNDSAHYTPDILIIPSEGIKYIEPVLKNGIVTKDDNLYHWHPVWDKTKKAETKLKFQAITTGTQQITFQDVSTDKKVTIPISVADQEITVITEPTTKISVDGNHVLNQGETISYTINASTSDKTITSLPLEIHWPPSAEILNLDDLQKICPDITVTETNANLVLTGTFLLNEQGKISIPVQVRFNEVGTFAQIVYYDGKIIDTTTFIVKPSTYTHLAFTRVKLNDETIDAMGSNIIYKVISQLKFSSTNPSLKYKVTDYLKNLRFGVFNDSEDYLDDEYEFINHTNFTTTHAGTNYQIFKQTFKYNPKYPVYLVWSHEFTESENYDIFNIDFLEPILLEDSNPHDFEEVALYPHKPMDLIQSENWASVNLPSHKQTSSAWINTWDSGGLFDLKDIIVQGLQVEWQYNVSEDVELQLTIFTFEKVGAETETHKGYRNITLKKGSGTKAIGDAWDTFGLKPHNLRNLNSMALSVRLVNRDDNTIACDLNDFKIKVHILNKVSQEYGFEIEGERAEEYGIFLKDMTWDFGTKNDVKYYQTSGTDENTAYRSNIDKKDLEIEFTVGDCDFEESTVLLEKIAKLFTNDRTTYNKPIPKYILFDHMPNYKFWFVREEALDTKQEYGVYNVTAKLVIPSGTAENISNTVTGSSGSNMSVARVFPLIVARVNKKGAPVTITEQNTKQALTINYDAIEVDDVIFIHSYERRIAHRKHDTNNYKNITENVDVNSTWFSIMGEYNFIGTNCDITEVVFKERW